MSDSVAQVLENVKYFGMAMTSLGDYDNDGAADVLCASERVDNEIIPWIRNSIAAKGGVLILISFRDNMLIQRVQLIGQHPRGLNGMWPAGILPFQD